MAPLFSRCRNLVGKLFRDGEHVTQAMLNEILIYSSIVVSSVTWPWWFKRASYKMLSTLLRTFGGW